MNRLQGMAGYTWNKFIKREIYTKVRFPKVNLTVGEDPIQMFQVAYFSKSAAFVNENLYFHRDGGVSAQNTKRSFIPCIQSAIYIKETIEILFNGIIPKNLKIIFCHLMCNTAYFFFYLNKKERQVFEKEFKPLLPELIKHQKKLRMKILLYLANKGIVFPFKFYELMKSFKLVKFVRRTK